MKFLKALFARIRAFFAKPAVVVAPAPVAVVVPAPVDAPKV